MERRNRELDAGQSSPAIRHTTRVTATAATTATEIIIGERSSRVTSTLPPFARGFWGGRSRCHQWRELQFPPLQRVDNTHVDYRSSRRCPPVGFGHALHVRVN